jgi:1D-myo-inositol-triphosphate 3-kinase
MVQINAEEPNTEEKLLGAITKPRYMIWRETISSTATLGFRIEGIKCSDGITSKDFKTTNSENQVENAFKTFIESNPNSNVRFRNYLFKFPNQFNLF